MNRIIQQEKMQQAKHRRQALDLHSLPQFFLCKYTNPLPTLFSICTPTPPKFCLYWENSGWQWENPQIAPPGWILGNCKSQLCSSLDLPGSVCLFLLSSLVFKVSNEGFGPDDPLLLLKIPPWVDLFSALQLRRHPAKNVSLKQFLSPLTNT